MTISGKMVAWLVAALLVGVGIGFFIGSGQAIRSINQQIREQRTGVANPASVNCVQTLGGTLEIADTAQGAVGYCHLKDGRVCEEWSLFRDGSCKTP